MIKIFKRILEVVLSVAFAMIFAVGFASTLTLDRLTAEAKTYTVNVDLSKVTCTEFAVTPEGKDVHKTRLLLVKNELDGPNKILNMDFPEALACITVNGKTIAEHQSDYVASGSPKIETTDMYINQYGAQNSPMYVFFTAASGMIVFDICIPENYLPANQLQSVGVTEGFSVTSDGDDVYTYNFSGTITIENPNVEETPTVYTVTVDGVEQKVEEGQLATAPETPTKAETDSCVYTFEGWFVADTGTPFSFSTPITSDLAIVSKFTETAKYTVTIDGVSKTYLAGEKLEKPNEPTRAATEAYTYQFVGWKYTDKSGEEAIWDFNTGTVWGNHVLTAHFEEIEKAIYTITFDPDNDTNAFEYKVYDGATLKEKIENPTKAATKEEHYTFAYWTLDGSTAFNFNTPITENITLKAYYTTTAIYIVTIDGVSKSYLAGDKLEKPNEPTKTDTEAYTYEFMGWKYTDKLGKEAIWDFNTDTVWGNHVLTAYFEETEKAIYTITFDPDNDSDSFEYKVYDGAILKENVQAPVKEATKDEHYTFAYWTLDGVTEFDFNTPITNDITLKAYYMTTAIYTVTIDGVSQSVLAGEKLEKPNEPTKAATEAYTYEFVGWKYTDKSGEEAIWDFNADTVWGNHVLTAHFEEIEKAIFTITFDPDNDSDAFEYEVYDGATLKEEIESPTKEATKDEHYTFAYWTLDGLTAFDFNTPITENITLKACYTTTAIYTVTIDGVSKTYLAGEKLEKPNEPTKAATEAYTYEFVGWKYTDKSGKEAIWDFNADTVWGNHVLTAHFKETEKAIFTITFDPDNDTDSFNFQVYDGATLKEEIEAPTKEATKDEHYTFAYWTLDGSTAFDFNTPITENITLKAYYTTTAIYTVTIDGVSQSVLAGDKLEKPNEPTKAATEAYTYEFVGWKYTDKSGKEAIWDFNADTVWGNHILTAHFEEIEKAIFTITFDPNNDTNSFEYKVYDGATLREEIENPTKEATKDEHYTFAYWTLDGSTAFNFNTPITESITLKAYYTTTAIYIVTIDDVSQSVLAGSKLTRPSVTPTKADTEAYTYQFVGWKYTDKSGEEAIWDFNTDTVWGNHVLTAYFEETEKAIFTITFDPDNDTNSFEYKVYDGATLKEEIENPTKEDTKEEHYTFAYWTLDGSTAFDFNTPITESITLKAYYTTTAIYTVTIDGISQSVLAGEKLEKPNEPTKAATEAYTYEFVGWKYTDKSGKEAIWDFNADTVWGNHVLNAYFEETEKAIFTITFDPDNDTNSFEYKVYDGATLREEIENPTKEATKDEHYTFAYWTLDGSTAFDFNTPITENITLKACYTTTAIYTVTIDGVSQSVLVGDKLEKPNEPTKAATEAYTYQFVGWKYTDKSGKEAIWDFNADTVWCNHVLTAHFEEIEKAIFTITFDPDNDSDAFEYEVYDGATLKEEIENPTKAATKEEHYTFAYWTLDGSTAFDFNTPITESITLKAYYTTTAIYVVTIDGEMQYVQAGGLAKEPEKPTKAETENWVYTFAGWFISDMDTAYDFSAPVNSNLEIVSKFTAIPKYTVSIDGEKQVVLSGAKLQKPSYTPTKDATESHTYAFVGWSYINNAGEKLYWNFKTDTVQGSFILTADFTPTEKAKFTVTFDANNGTDPIEIKVYDGSYIKPEQIPAEPQKMQNGHTMYAFYAWSADGVTAWEFNKNTPITSNLTLKALYSTKNVYTVSMDGEFKNYEEGARVEKPADPVKGTTAEYAYTFVGWYYVKDGTPTLWNFETDVVTADVALIPEFKASKIRYTLSIYANGMSFTRTLEWGEAIVYPALNEKVGYDFLGWVDENGQAAPALMPTKNLSVQPNWQMISYMATVECSNGITHTETYTLETAQSALENLKAFLLSINSAEYTYAWAEELPNALPLENQTFRANATKVRYKLTLVMDPLNAESKEERAYAWGEELKLTAPSALRGRHFLGWTTAEGGDLPTVMPKENLTVQANWEWIEYIMYVMNADGVGNKITYTALEADNPLYVQTTFAGYLIPENPKAYTYAWSEPLPTTLPLENGKIYRVVKTAIEYTITFAGAEGVLPITFTVETLPNLTLPEVPGKIGYTAQWDTTMSEITLENVTITAVYTPIKYTIQFVNAAEISAIVFTVETMQNIRWPAVPTRLGYVGRWDKTLSEIGLENVTVTALYEAISYTITFINAEGVEPMDFTIETLSSLTFPKVPQKAGYVGVWNKTPKDVTLENTTVTATYTPIEYVITFAGVKGIAPITFTVETMQDVVYPTLPGRIGYHCAWDKQPSDLALENTTVTAIYTPIVYTIEFINAEGVEAIEFTVESMNELRLPKVPEKAGYTGKWDKSLSDLGLKDATVTAIYTPIEYTIQFVGVENVAPITFTVETMLEVLFPEVPEKEGYIGVWDMTILELKLENIVVTAIYTKLPEVNKPEPDLPQKPPQEETPETDSSTGDSSGTGNDKVDEPVMDQLENYGDKLANSCFGSIGLSTVLLPLSAACAVLFKKKEE